MIGELNERYEIHEGTETQTGSGTEISYSKIDTVWGKAVSADSRVRERFDSLDSTVTDIIKLAGDPTLEYDSYKLKRVGDGQWYIPEAPPTEAGEYNRVKFVGVRRGQN